MDPPEQKFIRNPLEKRKLISETHGMVFDDNLMYVNWQSDVVGFRLVLCLLYKLM
jgi:hypothetical protein